MSEEKKDNQLNEVIRVKKRPSSFVLIDKTFLEDTRLSYKAKGILAYLLSKPDNWKVIVANLVNNSSDGKAAVYSGLRELKKYGYYEKRPVRSEDGRKIARWESTVYEVPVSLLTDFQEVDNQEIDNQFIENRDCNNNYINNNNRTNNNSQSCQTDSDRIERTLKENISYHDLQNSYEDDMALIDEFISIALDAVLSEGPVKINGENKPRELVRKQIMKLNYWNIVHVLEQFKEQKNKVLKKPGYILSMLYYSTMELNSHYTNLVNHYKGSDVINGQNMV